MRIAEKIEDQTKHMWESAPEDVGRVKARAGQGGFHFCPVVLCADELAALADELWMLREILRKKDLDVKSVSVILDRFLTARARRFESWYHLQDTSQLFKEASEACRLMIDSGELEDLVEALVLYVGRLNLWVELIVPWYELSVCYERTVR